MELTLSEIAEYKNDYLEHHGIRGQKWGVRRYQNSDGTYTEKGKKRYAKLDNKAMTDSLKSLEARHKEARKIAQNPNHKLNSRRLYSAGKRNANSVLARDAFDAKYNKNSTVKNKKQTIENDNTRRGLTNAGIAGGVIGSSIYGATHGKQVMKYSNFVNSFHNQQLRNLPDSIELQKKLISNNSRMNINPRKRRITLT